MTGLQLIFKIVGHEKCPKFVHSPPHLIAHGAEALLFTYA
jgi:hypothetical protein